MGELAAHPAICAGLAWAGRWRGGTHSKQAQDSRLPAHPAARQPWRRRVALTGEGHVVHGAAGPAAEARTDAAPLCHLGIAVLVVLSQLGGHCGSVERGTGRVAGRGQGEGGTASSNRGQRCHSGRQPAGGLTVGVVGHHANGGDVCEGSTDSPDQLRRRCPACA